MNDFVISIFVSAYVIGFIYFADLFEKKDTLKERVISKIMHIFYPITILIYIIRND